jgi:hypothetical protein
MKFSGRSVLIAVSLLVLAAAIYGCFGYRMPAQTNNLYTTASLSWGEVTYRNLRIQGIYKSLGLGTDYAQTSQDVFGEKRIYSWDKGRTFSSSRTYIRQADVDKTVAELRPKIEKAGFSFIGEPYPNAVDVQLHFKSTKGEYLRLTVSSKPRDDAVRQAFATKTDLDFSKIGYREAPSNVIIKVNLDDNNE